MSSPICNQMIYRTTIILAALAICLSGYARLALSEEPDQVLIYYANETAPQDVEAESFERIIGWLRSGGHPRQHEAAEALETDMKIFPAAVDVEVHSLKFQFPKTPAAPHAVIFTNRLARSGKYLLWRRGWQHFRCMDINMQIPEEAKESVRAANPLAHPDAFLTVLEEVARRFPPKKHEFVLITKSHGNSTAFVTPRLKVRASQTNREEVLREALRQPGDAKVLDDEGELCITKEKYLSLLATAGHRWDMQFALVYPEACYASVDEQLARELPNNVDRLCYNGAKTTRYINFVYPRILGQMEAGDSFSDAMLGNLPDHYVVLTKTNGSDRAAATWLQATPPALYFLPLLLWGLWWVRSRRWA